MEAEAGASPAALEAVRRIAGSPYGPLFFGVLGDMLAARDGSEASPELARPVRAADQTLRYIGENATRMDLFATMRLIEAVFPDRPRLGTAQRAREEPVRFGQEVSMAFALSSISQLEPAEDDHAPRLMQYVLGLFGPNGAMPTHLTDYVYERSRHHRDTAFARFADVFHHRALTLFYRAWALSQPTIGLDRPSQDAFSSAIAALCGLGMPSLRGRDGVPDHVKLSNAGHLVRNVRNAEGLKALLVNYFGVEIRVLCWMGHWMRIPADQQTRLGMRGAFVVLGVETTLGETVWDAQTAFRIVVGPLNHKRYLDFLPIGESLKRLMALVRLYAGEEYRFDVQLVLKNDEVPYSWLGNDVRLGWTSWLGVRLESSDATDYIARGLR